MACISALGIGSRNCIWSLNAHISAVSAQGDFRMPWAVVSMSFVCIKVLR